MSWTCDPAHGWRSWGAGTVGLAALMMARHLGVKQIIAVDTNPGRLETASELGATNTVDASDREARDAIQRLTGRGADYIAEFFELCEQPGIKYCSLNATFAEDVYTADKVVEHYAATRDRAARYDVTCDLENLPMWGVKTLRQACSTVSTADRPNGGIVFDTLHYVRSGSTLDMLKEIPGPGFTACNSTTARCGGRPA